MSSEDIEAMLELASEMPRADAVRFIQGETSKQGGLNWSVRESMTALFNYLAKKKNG